MIFYRNSIVLQIELLITPFKWNKAQPSSMFYLAYTARLKAKADLWFSQQGWTSWRTWDSIRMFWQKLKWWWWWGGGYSGIWCDTSWKLVCLYLMPHYARGCHISTLIIVPINFWQNSDLLKKKKLAQKMTKLEHFLINLSNFQ